MKIIIPALLIIILIGCEKKVETSENLSDIITENREFLINEYPSMDSVYDRLPSMTDNDIKRRAEHASGMIEKLKALDRNSLKKEEKITLELFRFIQDEVVSEYRFNAHYNPLLVDWGFHIGFAFLPNQVSFRKKDEYVRYINILLDYPRYTSENIALLSKGLELGISQSKIIFDGYEVTFDQHIVSDPEQSIFFKPFNKFPEHFSQELKDSLLTQGRKAIMDGVVEGYRRFSTFMKEDYMINTRESIGAYNLPNGLEYYQSRIKYYTTLDLSADSIHQLGLKEVARIRKEMQLIIDEVDFNGDFAEFLKFLRTDDRFYAKTPEELLMRASYISKKMDGKLPSLFGKLPRQPYTVNPVPDHLAPKYTGGRYVGAGITSTRPGQYWVNTYALQNRPLYILEALTFHEAVPGHHLQSALTQELTDLPEFRQNLYLSAFGEGWGLYSEFLGIEAGFYTDPYSRFGRLTYEMWRASRLVVDTGIHAFGWTRKEAMDYLATNTALSLHEVRTEVDRYISWPAQALSYKIGELKIKELRKKAMEALGEKFDIRDFHDHLLSQGTVTLEILDGMVESYIQDSNN